MEVAGVVLGAFPLALSAIDKYHEMAKVSKDYLRYKQTLKTIHREVFLQKRQLEITLEGLGLKSPTSLDAVRETLQRQQPNNYLDFMEIISDMDSKMVKLLDKLEIDDEDKTKEAIDFTKIASRQWRRISTAFGRKERKELIQDLQDCNNALERCLGRTREISSDQSDPLTRRQRENFDIKTCNEARENVRIIHEVLSRNWDPGCSGVHPSVVDLSWHQLGLDTTKALTLSFPEQDAMVPAALYWQQVSININQKPITPGEDHRKVECSQSETPRCTPSESSTPSMRRKLKFLFSRSEGVEIMEGNSESSGAVPNQHKLGSGLQSSSTFPAPGNQMSTLDGQTPISSLCAWTNQGDCTGFFLHSDERCERTILLEKAELQRNRFTTVSLRSFLPAGHIGHRSRRVKKERRRRLSRKERLAIAAAATWGVLLLCGTPWLEETWLREDDIMLLEEVPTDEKMDLPRTHDSHPAFLYTFKHCNTQQETGQITNDVSDFQGNQIQNKTLFTLGILLIETGLNRSFKTLREEARLQDYDSDNQGAQNVAMDDYTIATQHLLEDIYDELGDSYGDAVKRCLRCEFPGRSSLQTFNHDKFREQFYSGVVAPVQARYEMEPSLLSNFDNVP